MPKKSKTSEALGRLVEVGTIPREPLESHPRNDLSESPKPQPVIASLGGDETRRRTRSKDVEEKSESTTSLRVHAAFVDLADLVARNSTRSHHKKRNGEFQSQFADVVADPVLTTIFDAPYFKKSDFYGFYILFWLLIGFFILKDICHAWLDHSLTFYNSPVLQIFLSGLPKIALTEVVMYISSYGAYVIQYLCLYGWITWSRSGWIIQLVYEMVFISFWIYAIGQYVVRDQWIGRVFLVLHLLVILMKIHSYGFYNGYLWGILHELQFSEDCLVNIESKKSKIPEGYTVEDIKVLLAQSIAFCKYELLHQSHEVEKAKDVAVLNKNSADLCNTLIKFPHNINLYDFFWFSMYPTVVYELVFLRSKQIRWKYLAEKICAIVGVVSLMLIVAELTINPLVEKCNAARQLKLSGLDRLKLYFLTLVDMIPPFFLEYLLAFYLIWDTILNAIAELSFYVDRDFYGPWWSCTDWSEFARIWNRPVHRFLLRHVYHSSISAFSLSKIQAALVTFMLSSIVHELVMYMIFGRIRGYLLLFQMGQIPLVVISRLPFMRKKKTLGNVICWFGFVAGPPIILTLYLVY